jgi:hypothetical protein
VLYAMTDRSSTWSNAAVADGRSHDHKANSGDRIAHSSCRHWPTRAACAEVAEVALAYQFGISYDTYNLVADPEVRHSITPKRAH